MFSAPHHLNLLQRLPFRFRQVPDGKNKPNGTSTPTNPDNRDWWTFRKHIKEDWFCLDRIPYHGGELTVLWDKTGERYNRGKGFRVFYNNKMMHSSKKIEKFVAKL